MQVTNLLSQNPGAEAESRPAGPNLTIAFLGLIGIANAYLIDWTWAKGAEIAGLSALGGAMLLGFPLLASSWASLRRREVGINELVSLAFLASFATGDYRTAGMVAFFMQLGEAVESRTAAGARAAIDMLGKINPVVAAILHNAGSLLVVFNSARLVREGEELDPHRTPEVAIDPPVVNPIPSPC